MFNENYDYHTKRYNNDFSSVVFSNLCELIPEFQAEGDECLSFNQGILKKGMYSTVVKYSKTVIYRLWDSLRQMNSDFLASNRNSTKQYAQLSSEEFRVAEEIKNKYLKIPFMRVVTGLDEDIGVL